jgi:hypothetical protein
MNNKRAIALARELHRRVIVAKSVVQWVRDYYPDWSHRELDDYMRYDSRSCEMVHAEFDRRLREDGSPKVWKASVRRRLSRNNS